MASERIPSGESAEQNSLPIFTTQPYGEVYNVSATTTATSQLVSNTAKGIRIVNNGGNIYVKRGSTGVVASSSDSMLMLDGQVWDLGVSGNNRTVSVIAESTSTVNITEIV